MGRQQQQDDVCSVYICWWLNVRESAISVCSELCPVFFLVVSECMSLLLYLVRVLIMRE